MFLPIVQQVISKCSQDLKHWEQGLYSGPQVLMIDGPLSPEYLFRVGASISRMLQYNYPGIEAVVIDASQTPELDFISYRIINNCRKDMVTIVSSASTNMIDSKLKSLGFSGKLKNVLLFENLNKIITNEVLPFLEQEKLNNNNNIENKITRDLSKYSSYFKISKTLKYTSIFAVSEKSLLLIGNTIKNKPFQALRHLLKLSEITELKRYFKYLLSNTYGKWIYFSPVDSSSIAIDAIDKSSDAVANELLVRLDRPRGYCYFQMFNNFNVHPLSSN